MVLLFFRGNLASTKTAKFHRRHIFDLKEIILRNLEPKAPYKSGIPESPGEIGYRTTLCFKKALWGKQGILPSHQVISVAGDQHSDSGARRSPAQVALKGNCFSFHQQVSKLDHLGDPERPGKKSGHPSVRQEEHVV